MSEKVAGVLGWAGIACVLGGVIVRLTMPEQEEIWYWSLVAGIAIIVVYALTQWRDIVDVFGPRQIRYGALASSSVLLALAILVAVNFILARQNKRWDLTAARQYSLAQQTVQILESLESPVRIIVFARDIDFPRYQDRLAEYEYSSSQVSLEFVDVDKNPIQAQQYDVQAYGTVVLEYEGRVERVVSDQEQDLTNGLIKVIEGAEQRVYFVQGHGERVPDGQDRDGYGAMGEALRGDNLLVETVVLAQTGEVPEDAAVVVIAGPNIDFLDGEIDALSAYLDTAGKLLVLLDPESEPDAVPLTNLTALVAEWGIEVGQDVVVDFSGVGQILGTDATVPVAASYPPHPITDNFALLTAFPLARSVSPITGGANGRFAQSFVETSSRSWAETTMEELANGEVQMNDGDSEGPISIAVAVSVAVAVAVAVEPATDEVAETDPTDDSIDVGVEAEDDPTPSETRVAVIGDSDFAANSALGISGNRDLILNTINWLAQQENLISIRPRQPEDRRITLTAAQQLNLNLVTMLMIPGVILGSGVYTWWRRR